MSGSCAWGTGADRLPSAARHERSQRSGVSSDLHVRFLWPDPEWSQRASVDAQRLEQHVGVVDGEDVCSCQLAEVLVDDGGGCLLRGRIEIGLEDGPGVALGPYF